ncbi:hypothetical protein [Rhizobium laguerreae]|uniref:hypothetical protein n=1 Tax=Rhizobium laguerreae TaxID=1076926 RepID=UPI003CCE61BA
MNSLAHIEVAREAFISAGARSQSFDLSDQFGEPFTCGRRLTRRRLLTRLLRLVCTLS